MKRARRRGEGPSSEGPPGSGRDFDAELLYRDDNDKKARACFVVPVYSLSRHNTSFTAVYAVLRSDVCSIVFVTMILMDLAVQALESMNEFQREAELARRYEEVARERQRAELLSNAKERKDGMSLFAVYCFTSFPVCIRLSIPAFNIYFSPWLSSGTTASCFA